MNESARIVTLPRRQQHAILELVAQPTVEQAAKCARVGKTTLYAWLQTAPFQAAYREARYTVMNEALAILQKACTKAAQTLVALMDDADVSPFVRLQAAQAVLDTALKSRTVDELETRIAALEAASAAEHTPDRRSA